MSAILQRDQGSAPERLQIWEMPLPTAVPHPSVKGMTLSEMAGSPCDAATCFASSFVSEIRTKVGISSSGGPALPATLIAALHDACATNAFAPGT